MKNLWTSQKIKTGEYKLSSTAEFLSKTSHTWLKKVLAKKYPLETLGFWQPARMCSSWWMTEATNAARASCHTTAHTSVFSLSWKSTVKGCHAYRCWGGAQGILTLGCQFSYCFCKFAPMVSRAFWGPIDRGSKKQNTHESFWPQLSRSAY